MILCSSQITPMPGWMSCHQCHKGQRLQNCITQGPQSLIILVLAGNRGTYCGEYHTWLRKEIMLVKYLSYIRQPAPQVDEVIVSREEQ